MPRMNWGTSALPAVQLTTPEFAAKELLCFSHLIGVLKIAVISIILVVVARHGFLAVAASARNPHVSSETYFDPTHIVCWEMKISQLVSWAWLRERIAVPVFKQVVHQ